MKGDYMKKTTAIVIILLILIASAYAEGTRVLESGSKIISAYKLSISSESVPQEQVTLRLMTSDNEEFGAFEILGTPLDARDSDYPAFYWVLGGNRYGNVSLEFEFFPMWRYAEENTSAIPYKVMLSHVTSKVGNTVLAINKDSVSLPIEFLNAYKFYYADSVSYSPAAVEDPGIAVSGTSNSATVLYNLKTSYTRVTTLDDVAADYQYSVCNYWTRMGLAIIHLQIDASGVTTSDAASSGIQMPDGMYYATVKVTIVSGN